MNQQPILRPATLCSQHNQMKIRLCELQVKMLQITFPSDDATELLHTLEATLEFCESVTRQEQSRVLSKLNNKAAAIVADLEEDHETEEELIARLRYLVKRWRQREQQQDFQAIIYGFGDFLSFKLSHINKEERELIPILWQNFSDEELLEMDVPAHAPMMQLVSS